MPAPSGLAPRPVHSTAGDIKWINRPACGMLFGELATDGSGMLPRHPALRRAGWAVAMLDPYRRVLPVAYGAVPIERCPLQRSRDAEDGPVLVVARLSIAANGRERRVDASSDVKCIHIACKGTLSCFEDRAGCQKAGNA